MLTVFELNLVVGGETEDNIADSLVEAEVDTNEDNTLPKEKKILDMINPFSVPAIVEDIAE